MRRIIIRGGLAVAAILVLGIAWLVLARPLSELVEAVWKVRVASLSPSPLGWNGTWLQFGPPIGDVERNFVGDLPGIDPQFRSLDLGGPGPNYGNAADIAVDAQGRLVLTAGGKRFVLGARTGNHIPIDPTLGDMPEFAADPGDSASLVIEHSLFAWPTPFRAQCRRHGRHRDDMAPPCLLSAVMGQGVGRPAVDAVGGRAALLQRQWLGRPWRISHPGRDPLRAPLARRIADIGG